MSADTNATIATETPPGAHGCSLQRMVRPRGGYLTILADPPWPMKGIGKHKDARNLNWKGNGAEQIWCPYPLMTMGDIKALPVGELAADGCHLWLWTCNTYLREGFDVMDAWGFKYLAPITWVKPSGVGRWFVHRTQTLLFGYRSPLRMTERYKPTVVVTGNPKRHSQKPDIFHATIEQVSQCPRLEIFARERRLGWDVWGNEV